MVRVVSLLPSATEIVAALGHADALVGRSHECDHPPDVERLPVVSRPRREPVGSSAEIDRGVVGLLSEVLSIYRVDVDALVEAAPDLIVTQDLCRVCAVAQEEVAAAAREHLDGDVEIVTSSPMTLVEVLDDVERIAAALGDVEAGRDLRARLEAGFAELRERAPAAPARPRVAVLEWVDPLMGCGNWAPELVEVAGGEPVLANPGGHTPRSAPENLAAAAPDVVVVGPCGYDLDRALLDAPLLAALPGWDDLPAVRQGRVAFLDGSAYLNRPGPRLLDTARILRDVISGAPDDHHGWCWWR